MSVLDYVFKPRSIAIVGISTTQPHHWTRAALTGLLDIQYDGNIYPVNLNGGKLQGLEIYQSLQDVPEIPDYVIGLVSAAVSPKLVKECAAKGVKVVQFVTAGFSETGEEEGKSLEAEIVKIVQDTGVRVIGPNCLGVYCPQSHLSFSPFFPHDGGKVGFISQSGGNATSLVRQAAKRGIRFSKVVSYGNACDLNESDFLEYLTDDGDTDIICLYIEGTKNGKRFHDALKKAVRKKPVVLLKGGFTEAGSRTVASHTGALSGNRRVWESLCRQLGVIQVYSIRELVDILVTFLFFKPIPRGKNAALIGAGGGSSVLLTDAFEKRGLCVPVLPDNLYRKLREFAPVAGNILRNPLDFTQGVDDIRHHVKMADMISEWNGIDFIIRFLVPTNAVQPGILDPSTSKVIGEFFTRTGSSSKPMAAVVEASVVPAEIEFVNDLTKQCQEAGLAVYDSFDAAANAINLVLDYHKVKTRY